jgi:hypothetical protein
MVEIAPQVGGNEVVPRGEDALPFTITVPILVISSSSIVFNPNKSPHKFCSCGWHKLNICLQMLLNMAPVPGLFRQGRIIKNQLSLACPEAQKKYHSAAA